MIAALIPGLLGLGIGGYFVLKNVVFPGSALNAPRGPHACEVLSPAIATSVLGPSAQIAARAQPNPHETHCVWATGAGRFISLDVGAWDFIKVSAPASGKSNQGVGTGTYLLNTGVATESTIASGSAVGRVARKGDVGLFVSAGNYGQFFGGSAERELALEDRLEQQLIPELLPRL